MTKVQVYRVCFFFGHTFPSWVELDDAKDRITGKWRVIDDDVSFEVEHGHWEAGLFRKKWVTSRAWYGSDSVRFVQEFDCAT